MRSLEHIRKEQAIRDMPPGWLTNDEASWLWDEASKARVVLEIGCWLGRSTSILCAACPGHVYTVDHFQGSTGEDAYWYKHANGGDFGGIKRQALTNLAPHLESGKLTVIEQSVHDFYRQFAYTLFKFRQPDLIFIDGAHDTESFALDVYHCQRFIAEYGLLCGHDSNHKGIEPILPKLLPNHRIAPNTHIWYLPQRN